MAHYALACPHAHWHPRSKPESSMNGAAPGRTELDDQWQWTVTSLKFRLPPSRAWLSCRRTTVPAGRPAFCSGTEPRTGMPVALPQKAFFFWPAQLQVEGPRPRRRTEPGGPGCRGGPGRRPGRRPPSPRARSAARKRKRTATTTAHAHAHTPDGAAISAPGRPAAGRPRFDADGGPLRPAGFKRGQASLEYQ